MKIDYHNLYTHMVIVTQDRMPLIKEPHRDRIEKYITGVVANHHSKMYSIYINPEHMHCLISRSPKISDELLATIIADSSQVFINNNRLAPLNFKWQQSCAAFSVSKSDVDRVCRYILNQPQHHAKTTFAEEYDNMMKFYLKGHR